MLFSEVRTCDTRNIRFICLFFPILMVADGTFLYTNALFSFFPRVKNVTHTMLSQHIYHHINDYYKLIRLL